MTGSPLRFHRLAKCAERTLLRIRRHARDDVPGKAADDLRLRCGKLQPDYHIPDDGGESVPL